MADPHTLASPTHAELLIKKSRFVACVQPCASREDAAAVVAALWREHPGASHVCWALMAGGQSAAVDDGEPGGTAGRPMLEVLRHQALEDVLATVVRYFGGVRLGAGGLVRAYTDAVASALLKADKVPRRRRIMLRCEVPYALEGSVRRRLAVPEVSDLTVSHSSLVRFDFRVDADARAYLADQLDDIGQGRLAWLDPN
ncbi:MAG: DUF1949 domain-containing protein [Betaproteobacteria bacterium]|nr:DUF1949 domain-containing protein [Betaproteobacteria bacterium]